MRREVTARAKHVCEKCKVSIKEGERCMQEYKGGGFHFYCLECRHGLK